MHGAGSVAFSSPPRTPAPHRPVASSSTPRSRRVMALREDEDRHRNEQEREKQGDHDDDDGGGPSLLHSRPGWHSVVRSRKPLRAERDRHQMVSVETMAVAPAMSMTLTAVPGSMT